LARLRTLQVVTSEASPRLFKLSFLFLDENSERLLFDENNTARRPSRLRLALRLSEPFINADSLEEVSWLRSAQPPLVLACLACATSAKLADLPGDHSSCLLLPLA
jgi:hypothetical protein